MSLDQTNFYILNIGRLHSEPTNQKIILDPFYRRLLIFGRETKITAAFR